MLAELESRYGASLARSVISRSPLCVITGHGSGPPAGGDGSASKRVSKKG